MSPPISSSNNFTEALFDIVTLSFISAIVLFSILSLYFIFYLRIKSRTAQYLQTFSSLWTIRIFLVFWVFLWAVFEVLRLPIVRQDFFYPFLPSITPEHQKAFCRVHVTLSLGFFEPGFLVTVLVLLTASIKKQTSQDGNKALGSCIAPGQNSARGIFLVFGICLPIYALQHLLVVWLPGTVMLPENFWQSYIPTEDETGNEVILCTSPLGSTLIFGAFAVSYCIWFSCNAWKVASLVINKGLRKRICGLIFTVLITVPLQIASLGCSEIWKLNQVRSDGFILVEFLCTLICATVAESVLVIKPVLDSLSIEGPSSLFLPRSRKLEQQNMAAVNQRKDEGAAFMVSS